jgi:hypothetical protein
MRADNAKMQIVMFNTSDDIDLITLFHSAGASTCIAGPAGPLSLIKVLRCLAPPDQATGEPLFKRAQERTAHPTLPFRFGGDISQAESRGDR